MYPRRKQLEAVRLFREGKALDIDALTGIGTTPSLRPDSSYSVARILRFEKCDGGRQ
jgi:hypothetical protein